MAQAPVYSQAELMRHIRMLSVTIGPRRSASPAEGQAAEYVAAELRQWADTVAIQPFASAPTYGWSMLFTVVMAIAGGLLAQWFPWPGFILATAGAGAYLLYQMGAMEWLNRVCPFQPSRNVVAVIRPSGAARRRAVLAAHMDTARSAPMYNPTQIKGMKASVLLSAGLGVLLAVLTLLAALLPGVTAIRWAALLPAAGMLYAAYMMLHRELFCQVVPGANDNASGVAALIELGRRFSAHRLAETELWLVATGSEEVIASIGMGHFVRRYGAELRGAAVIALDNFGAGDLRYLKSEGLLCQAHSSPELLDLAAQVASRHPDWQVKPSRCTLGYTDAIRALGGGLKAMAIWAERPNGDAPEGIGSCGLPHYHWPSDTIEHIEPETVARACAFTGEMLEAIDAGALEAWALTHRRHAAGPGGC